MGNRRVAAIAGLYGIFAAMLTNALIATMGEGARVSLVTFPVLTTLGFFVMFRFTVASAWNARAERLASPKLQ